jgi:ADP-ribosylglycohydrolase
MIGAVIGDMVGSPYELNTVMEVGTPDWKPLFHPTLSKFTDDTVLTMATADAILEMCDTYGSTRGESWPPKFHVKYREWARRYPNRGYGGTFWAWANQDLDIKNKSYADGCMMRCSPIGIFQWDNLELALELAEESIQWTHNSPESLRGVSAITAAICMGFQGKSKAEIKAFVEEQYGHWLDADIQTVKTTWEKRNIRCNITCAQALICFLYSDSFESAIRLAVYTEGDCDTIAAIAGSLAEAFYGPKSIPRWMIDEAKKRLPQEMIDLTNKFYARIGMRGGQEPYKDFVI